MDPLHGGAFENDAVSKVQFERLGRRSQKGNAAAETKDLEPAANGAADRRMVCYKYDAPNSDPLYNSNPQLATVRWREAPVNLPEAALTGSEYIGDPFEGDIVISNAAHWLMNGTGLRDGDHLMAGRRAA